MKSTTSLRTGLLTGLVTGLLALASCKSSSPAVVDTDDDQRAVLFGPVAALAGTWRSPDPTGGEATTTEFVVSSNGSAVREIMMKGTPHEMTNMYTLDGNSLVMVHYCAGGNQPKMRARAVDGNTLVFEPDGVSDLKSASEPYMASMTLVTVDANTVEQHWTALTLADGGVHHENVIRLERVR